VSLSILPGEFVAIVGGSGAGKTTLLDAMAGLRPATSGTVYYNGRDYYRCIDDYRHVLGYVPQDDIIHGELAVAQTLWYSARLRLPRDTSKESIATAVAQRLDDLGLSERAALPVSRLSGGQRKRASIAIELLTEPRVFFLDEPTSGLDPATDRQMMKLLSTLAEDGRTVVLTTHATKNVGLCDKIVVLARDGNLAFVGPPAAALEYFGVEAFDEIYDCLEEGSPEQWGARFRESPSYPRVEAGGGPGGDVGTEVVGRRRGLRQVLRQFRVLSARNFTIHRKPQNLMPLLMQPVVISLLILSLFHSGIWKPSRDASTAALQLVYTFDFVMFLFGLLFGAQEMVRESSIFRRERTVDVRVLPYLLSKATFLAPLLALVATAMTTVFWLTGRLPDAGLDVYLPLLLTLMLTGWAGMAMSLLISSAVRTSQQATDLLTPWIAPQVLFAGALFAVPSMNVVGRALSNVTAVRWSFEASSHVTHMKDLFTATGSEVGRALSTQYAASFNGAPARYWVILACFVIIPLVVAGRVLSSKTR
jgi:ABC-type multidrug transport system ATPase subunit